MFNEVAPYSDLESRIALDAVPLWGGHWYTGQSIVATFSLTVLAAGDKFAFAFAFVGECKETSQECHY